MLQDAASKRPFGSNSYQHSPLGLLVEAYRTVLAEAGQLGDHMHLLHLLPVFVPIWRLQEQLHHRYPDPRDHTHIKSRRRMSEELTNR